MVGVKIAPVATPQPSFRAETETMDKQSAPLLPSVATEQVIVEEDLTEHQPSADGAEFKFLQPKDREEAQLQDAVLPLVAEDEVNDGVNGEVNGEVIIDEVNDKEVNDDDMKDEANASSTPLENDMSMALNEAFVALENMRKANLEVEFGATAMNKKDNQASGDAGSTSTPSPAALVVNHEFCTSCFRQHRHEDLAQQRQQHQQQQASRYQWLRTAVHTRRRHRQAQVKSPPCLICASPVCKRHSCPDYRREGIPLCGDCAPLFQKEPQQDGQRRSSTAAQGDDANNNPTHKFVMTKTLLSADTSPEERQRCLAHMIDAYDRARLLLQYSCQSHILDAILDELEDTKHKHNHVNLGSSGMGLLSGVTGMGAVAAQAAAAVTALSVLTPAGPPLLIASILLGGTAAVATTGTEAYAHFSQANQLANRILSLHALLVNLWVMTQQLQESTTTPKNKTGLEDGSIVEVYTEGVSTHKKDTAKKADSFASEATAEMSDETDDEDANDEDIDEIVASSFLENEDQEEDTDCFPERSTGNVAPEVRSSKPTASYSLQDIDDDDDDDCGSRGDTSAKPDDSSETTEESAVSKLDDIPCKDTTAESSNETAAAVPKERSAIVRGAMPLAPLVDDFLLGFFQMVSRAGPTGNARVALSRASTNAMKVAQLATVACGALSAATIILEAQNLNNTINSLRAGSPCEKAQKLRKVQEELDMFPETHVIAEQLMACVPRESMDANSK